MFKRYPLIILLIAGVLGSLEFIKISANKTERIITAVSPSPLLHPIKASPLLSSPSPSVIGNPLAERKISFTSQAPQAQWNDPVFQDGCEEASVIMAMHWVRGTSITSSEQATREIQELSKWELEKYNEFRDRSAADTAQMIKDYYKYEKVSLLHDVTAEDVQQEILKGNILIMPMDGRVLHNPHFTQPGPERHMIVVHGYDQATDEFITNDPGTKHGMNFRYKSKNLESATRDYPTGYHEPIREVKRVAIVVSD